MIKNVNQNIYNNPEFDFYLFNDNDCRYFIKSNFDEEILNTYDKLNQNNQSEFWKYCILYINGGAYIDINLKINDPLINIITSEISKNQDTMLFTKNNNSISNKVIIVPPGLPIFKDLIYSYINNKNNSLMDLISKYKYNYSIKLYTEKSENNIYIKHILTNNTIFEYI